MERIEFQDIVFKISEGFVRVIVTLQALLRTAADDTFVRTSFILASMQGQYGNNVSSDINPYPTIQVKICLLSLSSLFCICTLVAYFANNMDQIRLLL